ncbi:MAG: hypothetical protein IAE95_04545, partial [Chitinophagaceae bacterium]|nr:hypothetical protein [Chitinophagaceae bacterium]
DVYKRQELFGYFMEMVSKRDPELAHSIHPYIDEFISSRASVYTQHIQPDTFNSLGRIPVPEVDNTEQQLDRQEQYFSDPDIIEAYKQWGIPHPYDEQPSSNEPTLPTTNEETSGTEPQNTPPEPSHTDTQVGRSAQFLGSKMQPTSHTPIDNLQPSQKSTQIKFPAQPVTANDTKPSKNWKELKITPPPSHTPAQHPQSTTDVASARLQE